MPRLRMFAGPNGSGKSTLLRILPRRYVGVYINPDDLEAQVRESGILDLAAYEVECPAERLRGFMLASPFLVSAGLREACTLLRPEESRLYFNSIPVNSYLASVVADFIRRELLHQRASFTFETVMSSRDKVDFLALARGMGYRTYLYFVSTAHPTINVSRVMYRTRQGGHGVPEDKIRSRYDRSLELLPEAVRNANRAYIFDNSREAGEFTWIAEITDGQVVELRAELIPDWFVTRLLNATESE